MAANKKKTIVTDGRVTIGLVNYNNLEMIEKCLDSVLNQQGGPYRTIFVDNASTDGSRELVEKKYAHFLEIVHLPENRGPNPSRNVILNMAQSEFVLFVDADTLLEHDTVVKLVSTMDHNPMAGAMSPIVMDYNNRHKIQFMGTLIHYIGAAIHINEKHKDTYPVTSLGGACLLVRKKVADWIGGWDSDLFFGWTDGDFLFRLDIAGYQTLCVTSTKIFHPPKTRGFSKAYHQIRNRWYFILKNYAARTIFFISPMLVLYEFFLVFFMLMKKQLRLYFKANFSVIQSLPSILSKRKSIQKLRKVRDRDFLTAGNFTVREDVLGHTLFNKLLTFLNRGIDSYWILVRNFC